MRSSDVNFLGEEIILKLALLPLYGLNIFYFTFSIKCVGDASVTLPYLLPHSEFVSDNSFPEGIGIHGDEEAFVAALSSNIYNLLFQHASPKLWTLVQDF